MVNFIELLPPECTLAILSFLPPADLCQAVRVSSSWREVVEPLLYKHVAISSLDEMMRLLASVERRPQLSEYVRQFLVWEIDPSPAYEDVTSRVVRQFADLRGLFLWRWPFNLHFLSGHSHLKWITLHQRKARPMNQVRPLWDLPNVECIHATLEEPEAPVDQWPIARKLVTLELYTCTLSERSLEILLQASPGLKSLHFANRYNIGIGLQQDCRALACALGHVSRTLEVLHLRLSVYSSYAEEVEYLRFTPVDGHIGPLKSFHRLREIKLPIVTLLGWEPTSHIMIADILPPSVTQLGLVEDLVWQCTYRWEEWLVIESIQNFLRAMDRANSHLTLLEFWPRPIYNYNRWGYKLEDQVRTACRQAGVECNFRTDDGLRTTPGP